MSPFKECFPLPFGAIFHWSNIAHTYRLTDTQSREHIYLHTCCVQRAYCHEPLKIGNYLNMNTQCVQYYTDYIRLLQKYNCRERRTIYSCGTFKGK